MTPTQQVGYFGEYADEILSLKVLRINEAKVTVNLGPRSGNKERNLFVAGNTELCGREVEVFAQPILPSPRGRALLAARCIERL